MPRSLAFIFVILFQNLKFAVQFSFDLEAHHLYKLDRGCKDVDIRFDSFYFYKLKNCDRVHGFLRISDLVFDEKVEPFGIREITGYLLIENVQNLKNLSQILPDLTLINGEKLFRGKYAISIVNNIDLETYSNEIVYVAKGEVQVENNSKNETRSLPNFCSNSSEVFCWQNGSPPNLCNNLNLSDCSSKVCEKFLVTSLEDSSDNKTCNSAHIPGYLELEKRFKISDEDCTKMGRTNYETDFCILESQRVDQRKYYSFDPDCPEKQNCTIFINGTESFENVECCKTPYAVEIINLQEEFNETFSKNLSKIVKIETCLIIWNSPAITSLHDLRNLKQIDKGCEWNGSNYTIIIENNENLETLLPPQSEINLAQEKILITGNPKLKDTNGIFRCNFPEFSVQIFAKKDSALIITDFDVTKDAKFSLYFHGMGDNIQKKSMQTNSVELTNLSPNEFYKTFFGMNETTNMTDNCSFKTMRRNEFIEDFESVRNRTELEVRWTLTRDESFLRNEGYKFFMSYRNISRDMDCHENQLQLPILRKYGEYSLTPISQHELDERGFENFAIENTSMIFENLENGTCYRFEFMACIETNLLLCEPSALFFARTLGDDENEPDDDPRVALVSIIFIITLILLFAIFLVTFFLVKKRKQKDEIASVEMNELMTPKVEVKEVTILENKVIGQGHFGKVFIGYLEENDKILYAIKVGNSCLNEEAMLMEKLNTHHIVKFIKYSLTENNKPCLVMEYLKHGDLKTFLQANRLCEAAQCGNYRPQNFKTIRPVWEMAIEIADGMAYLADKGYIHNDLAARNCLVHQDFTIKIGDFGMARSLHDRAYYKPINEKLLPLRWLAPETLDDIPVFTVASDVYSYGVVLYELATFCETPYHQFTDEQARAKIKRGELLEKPEKCDDKFYALMKSCWSFNPSERRSFKEKIKFLLENFQIPEKFNSVSYYHTQV